MGRPASSHQSTRVIDITKKNIYIEAKLQISIFTKCVLVRLNAIEVYVAWNSGLSVSALTAFLRQARQLDLLVFLRPGPYICAEVILFFIFIFLFFLIFYFLYKTNNMKVGIWWIAKLVVASGQCEIAHQ